MTSISYRVPYADTDQMGVVYYANYYVYFERLRNELMRDLGAPYSEWEAAGIGLPVIESHCQHRGAARYDDLLEIRGCFELLTAVRVKASCSVSRGAELLAEGYTIHASIDMRTMRPKRLPERWIVAMKTES